MQASFLNLKKEGQLIDGILRFCSLRFYSLRKQAYSNTDLSKETIFAAMSDAVFDIKSSSDKLDALERFLQSTDIFDKVTPLRFFKKVARFFKIDIEAMFKDAGSKVISEIKSSNKISENKISDIVKSSVSSSSPPEISSILFAELLGKFASTKELPKPYIRLAKICFAQMDSAKNLEEGSKQYNESMHVALGMAAKIIKWMISYAVQSANYMEDTVGLTDHLEFSGNNNYEENSQKLLSFLISNVPVKSRFVASKNYDENLSPDSSFGAWHIDAKEKSIEDTLLKWTNEVYPATALINDEIKSSSEFKSTLQKLLGLKNNNRIEVPISISKKELVDSFIDGAFSIFQSLQKEKGKNNLSKSAHQYMKYSILLSRKPVFRVNDALRSEAQLFKGIKNIFKRKNPHVAPPSSTIHEPRSTKYKVPNSPELDLSTGKTSIDTLPPKAQRPMELEKNRANQDKKEVKFSRLDDKSVIKLKEVSSDKAYEPIIDKNFNVWVPDASGLPKDKVNEIAEKVKKAKIDAEELKKEHDKKQKRDILNNRAARGEALAKLQLNLLDLESLPKDTYEKLKTLDKKTIYAFVIGSIFTAVGVSIFKSNPDSAAKAGAAAANKSEGKEVVNSSDAKAGQESASKKICDGIRVDYKTSLEELVRELEPNNWMKINDEMDNTFDVQDNIKRCRWIISEIEKFNNELKGSQEHKVLDKHLGNIAKYSAGMVSRRSGFEALIDKTKGTSKKVNKTTVDQALREANIASEAIGKCSDALNRAK